MISSPEEVQKASAGLNSIEDCCLLTAFCSPVFGLSLMTLYAFLSLVPCFFFVYSCSQLVHSTARYHVTNGKIKFLRSLSCDYGTMFAVRCAILRVPPVGSFTSPPDDVLASVQSPVRRLSPRRPPLSGLLCLRSQRKEIERRRLHHSVRVLNFQNNITAELTFYSQC
jgi:hypothetical protein